MNFMRAYRRRQNFIGIDFGTTKCGVAILSRDQEDPRLYKLDTIQDRWQLPSIVGLFKEPNLIPRQYPLYTVGTIGWEALAQSSSHDHPEASPTAFFDRIKLAIGTTMARTGADEVTLAAYESIKPEDLAAILLAEVRARLMKQVDFPVDAATITIPANWSPKQRKATKFAALLAGFRDVELVEEPIAALSYIARSHGKQRGIVATGKRVAIVDFGGGTCDAALVDVDTVHSELKIVEVFGVNALGGELVDQIILSELMTISESHQQQARPWSEKPMFHWKQQAEELKKNLNKLLVQAASDSLRDWSPSTLKVEGTRMMNDQTVSLSAIRLHELLFTNASRRELATLSEAGKDGHTVIKAFDNLICRISKSDKRKIDSVVVVGGSAQLYFVKPIILKYLSHLDIEKSLFVPADPESVQAVAKGAAWHERWRWDWEWRQPFKPKLFHNIWVSNDDLQSPLQPLVKAPHTLPLKTQSDPFSLSMRTTTFQVALAGNPANAHPDDEMYSLEVFRTSNGEDIDPKEHELQLTVRVTRDGILEMTAVENQRRLQLRRDDEYPLDEIAILRAREEITHKVSDSPLRTIV